MTHSKNHPSEYVTNLRYSYFILFTTSLMYVGLFVSEKEISDLHLTLPEIVRRNGYPSETHMIQTEDGYLLQLHRIPHGKSGYGGKTSRYPVLLFHGLTSSSHDWILNGPKKALGYRLADEGYDVWMANMRGNLYSKGHLRYSDKDNEYWDFSVHEMGIYDLPANIDYILKATNHQNLILISHSMGATVFYVMASTTSAYDDKILAQISLAPISAMKYAPSVIRLSAGMMYPGKHDESGQKLNILGDTFNTIPCNERTADLCTAVGVYPVYGGDLVQYDTSLTALYYSKVPSGSSAKTVQHFMQFMVPGLFRQFDYGRRKNLEKYGIPTPPGYNLSNINIPVRIYYGDADVLSTSVDNEILYKQLRARLGFVRVDCHFFNHLDFIAAKDINPLLNDDVIQFANNVTDSTSGRSFISTTMENAENSFNQMKLPSDTYKEEIASFDEILNNINLSNNPENVVVLVGSDRKLSMIN